MFISVNPGEEVGIVVLVSSSEVGVVDDGKSL
jgi:hypothetical protein